MVSTKLKLLLISECQFEVNLPNLSTCLITLRYVVDHFTTRGSMVYAAALDISKAFDAVNHRHLMAKLSQVGIPSWIINSISDWYSKLYVAVRWNGSLS